jgi:hypothetical protein
MVRMTVVIIVMNPQTVVLISVNNLGYFSVIQPLACTIVSPPLRYAMVTNSVRMALMRIIVRRILVLKASSSVRIHLNVFLIRSVAMAKQIARIILMRKSVHHTHVHPISSSVTINVASHMFGSVTMIMTVETTQMSPLIARTLTA